MFPSPQWLKPAHFRILTAPLKRCSTLYTKCETAIETDSGQLPQCSSMSDSVEYHPTPDAFARSGVSIASGITGDYSSELSAVCCSSPLKATTHVGFGL